MFFSDSSRKSTVFTISLTNTKLGISEAFATTKVESDMAQPFFMHYVYILHSQSADKYYIGSSSNPEGRLLAHNHPSNKGFTKRYQPWDLVFKKQCQTKAEAEAAERKIKAYKSRKMIEQILRSAQEQ